MGQKKQTSEASLKWKASENHGAVNIQCKVVYWQHIGKLNISEMLKCNIF